MCLVDIELDIYLAVAAYALILISHDEYEILILIRLVAVYNRRLYSYPLSLKVSLGYSHVSDIQLSCALNIIRALRSCDEDAKGACLRNCRVISAVALGNRIIELVDYLSNLKFITMAAILILLDCCRVDSAVIHVFEIICDCYLEIILCKLCLAFYLSIAVGLIFKLRCLKHIP